MLCSFPTCGQSSSWQSSGAPCPATSARMHFFKARKKVTVDCTLWRALQSCVWAQGCKQVSLLPCDAQPTVSCTTWPYGMATAYTANLPQFYLQCSHGRRLWQPFAFQAAIALQLDVSLVKKSHMLMAAILDSRVSSAQRECMKGGRSRLTACTAQDRHRWYHV